MLTTACTASPPTSEDEPEGLAALPARVSYVALGDSIATGPGAGTSYVDEFADLVEAKLDRDVTVTNLARNGRTSAELLQALRTDTALRTAVAGADLVTWNIGGNDLLAVLDEAEAAASRDEGLVPVRTTVEELTSRWDAIVSELVDLRRHDAVVLRTMDVYHPFVARHREAGLFQTLAPFLDEVNAHLAATDGDHGIRVADVHAAFNGPEGTRDPGTEGLLAPDGLHPSEAGHRRIAELLFDLG